MKKKIAILTVLVSFLFVSSVLFAAEIQVKPQADLPKVLIIGDSISLGYTPYVNGMGYTPYVTGMLKGIAVVKHSPRMLGDTGTALNRLRIRKGEWDIIHFNWGLWDLCYRNPQPKDQRHRDKVNGTLTTRLEQYEKNLDQLVVRLKKTGATLIWATTTVVPKGEPGRFVGDDKKYNDVAARIMKKHNILIDDLNSLTRKFPPSLFRAPGNVHYTSEGYKRIAKHVADKIVEAIRLRQATMKDIHRHQQ